MCESVAEAVGVEGFDLGGVEHGDVKVSGGGQDSTEGGAHCDDHRVGAVGDGMQPVESVKDWHGVLGGFCSEVSKFAGGDGAGEGVTDFGGVPRDDDADAWQGAHEGDVAGCLMGAAAAGVVEGTTTTDKRAGEVVVAEAEFDVFEGAFHEERRDGVHDRGEPGQGKASSNVNHECFADPDVDDAVGVLVTKWGEVIAGDFGPDKSRVVVVVDECCGGCGEGVTGTQRGAAAGCGVLGCGAAGHGG